ncbi:hypothetical protein RHGRI_012392 [Rhododendron griersonianum]|uniref:Ribosomal protein L34e superfamily protein n=1 Tax=Rhododendron griersonianum TaxID=479676 RepID=A0AAV6KQ78_9ERIC|nr:hypothetical protein RHGRI_012392 [Rhododendron griersonianum]
MRLHPLHLLSSLTATTTTAMSPPSSSSSVSLSKPTPSPTHKKPSNLSSNPNPNYSSPSLCNQHSPFLTLDLLILVLVLFSGTFLLTSYFSYIFHSLSLLPPLPSLSLSLSSPSALYFLGFSLFFLASILSFEICCGFRSRKCQNPRCKGLKKAMEFDLQLQTEECLRSSAGGSRAVREIDELPWKGGSEGNPDYECLRAELRKMAPPNGRAVLLFRAKCGCPIAKLEGGIFQYLWAHDSPGKHSEVLAFIYTTRKAISEVSDMLNLSRNH